MAEQKKNQDEQQQKTEQQVSWLKKLTVANVVGKPKQAWVQDGAVDLFTVYGLCRSYQEESTSYGPYLRFKGDFKAIDSHRRQYRGAAMILPKAAEDMLANMVLSAKEVSGQAYVEFGLVIGMTPSDAPIGYEFTVRPLIQEQDSDPLAALEAKLPPAK
jgi:hypothetical protein